MTTFSQAASSILLSSWTAFVGKTQRSMGPLPMLDELPVPPHSAELVLFPGCGCRRQGRGQTQLSSTGWSLLFASWCPEKQRENRECSSQKLKLVRVTSTVQELEFSFMWGIPQFCNGLFFFAGSKPESFRNSYKTKLGKDK